MTIEELNAKIKAMCVAKGMTFKLHECPPWEAHEGPSPWPPGTRGSESYPKAQALRR